MAERFDLDVGDLPATLPIFPLTGVLLLPQGRLPLNIFEPRYLAMVSEALAPPRLIGMIQPLEGKGDAGEPPVYPIGCAGRIVSFGETDDGRYLITLAGVARFEIAEELPLRHGYRRARADWSRFAGDFAATGFANFDRPRLLAALKPYFQNRNIGIDWDALAKTPDEHLVIMLAMACPIAPSEKQALLEAPNLDACAKLLTALLEMAATPQDSEQSPLRH